MMENHPGSKAEEKQKYLLPRSMARKDHGLLGSGTSHSKRHSFPFPLNQHYAGVSAGLQIKYQQQCYLRELTQHWNVVGSLPLIQDIC